MRIKTKALYSLIISHAERIWQENVIGLIQILASVTKGSAFFFKYKLHGYFSSPLEFYVF